MAVSCKLKRGSLSLKYNATLSSSVVSSQSSEGHVMRYFSYIYIYIYIYIYVYVCILENIQKW